MTETSALYPGRVTHRRLRPRLHKLAYRIFYLRLDLDRLDDLDCRLRLFSRNRFNLLSFHDADHLDGGPRPLRERVDAIAQGAGIDLAGGRIELVAMPRVLGHAFNPLSVYFCYAAEGALACMIYEVNNTFGQRHAYLIPVEAAAWRDGALHQDCAKRFYVSPFMDMDLDYQFRIEPPDARLTIGVLAKAKGETVLATGFSGERRPLSDRTILATVARHPLLGLKVLAGIHWEALWIWRKGLSLRTRPAPPKDAVTFAARTSGSADSTW